MRTGVWVLEVDEVLIFKFQELIDRSEIEGVFIPVFVEILNLIRQQLDYTNIERIKVTCSCDLNKH